VFWITASAIRGLNRRETAAAGSLSYTVPTPSSKSVASHIHILDKFS